MASAFKIHTLIKKQDGTLVDVKVENPMAALLNAKFKMEKESEKSLLENELAAFERVDTDKIIENKLILVGDESEHKSYRERLDKYKRTAQERFGQDYKEHLKSFIEGTEGNKRFYIMLV